MAVKSIEQDKYDGVSLRRCPACLFVTASRMTFCLSCGVECLGKKTEAPASQSSSGQSPAKFPSTSSTSAPAAASAPKVPNPLEVPMVPGVEWKFEEHSGFLFIVPAPRWVDSDKNTCADESAGWLAFYRTMASGNFLTLNSTLSSIVSKALLAKIEVNWPQRPPTLSDVGHFMTFLVKRPVGTKKTLADFLGRAEQLPDNCFRFEWKAFDVASLGSITKNADCPVSPTGWQTAWHGKWRPCTKLCRMDTSLNPERCLVN